MRTVQSDMDRDDEDDAAPVDMLAQLFEARGWAYEFAGEDEITGEVQGSWAKYQVRGIWRREDHVLQLLCLPDIRVPDDKRGPMFEAPGAGQRTDVARPFRGLVERHGPALPSRADAGR